MMTRHFLLAGLLAWAAPHFASSEETQTSSFDPFRALEVSAHRKLMDKIDETGRSPSLFETDGCSGGMSASWSLAVDLFPNLSEKDLENLPWRDCCVTHDRAYHNAGGATEAEESYDLRLQADESLRACVIETGETQSEQTAEQLGLSEAQVKTGFRVVAQSMYNAVRLGGGPCSGLPWRWGFGFDKCISLLK